MIFSCKPSKEKTSPFIEMSATTACKEMFIRPHAAPPPPSVPENWPRACGSQNPSTADCEVHCSTYSHYRVNTILNCHSHEVNWRCEMDSNIDQVSVIKKEKRDFTVADQFSLVVTALDQFHTSFISNLPFQIVPKFLYMTRQTKSSPSLYNRFHGRKEQWCGVFSNHGSGLQYANQPIPQAHWNFTVRYTSITKNCQNGRVFKPLLRIYV